jgi:hypothetical protein
VRFDTGGVPALVLVMNITNGKLGIYTSKSTSGKISVVGSAGEKSNGITPNTDGEDPTIPQGFSLGLATDLNDTAAEVLHVVAFQSSAAYNRASAR